MARKPIVGIIGGDDRREQVMSVGKAVAVCGAILLTGGGAPEESLKGTQVKDAAMAGYRKATGQTRGMIGILPSTRVNWDLSTSPGSLFLWTGMSSYERDAINGLTPDIVIAFRGGEGTLCELAFGFLANAPVLLAESLEHHRKKFREHKTRGSLRVALEATLNCYDKIGPVRVDAGELLLLLERALDNSSEHRLSMMPYSVDALRKELQALAPELGHTGFPGLPGTIAESKVKFEEVIVKISSLLT